MVSWVFLLNFAEFALVLALQGRLVPYLGSSDESPSDAAMAAPGSLGGPAPPQLVGCYFGTGVTARWTFANQYMDQTICAAYCYQVKTKYFAVSDDQCTCGDVLGTASSLPLCTLQCRGDASQICGRSTEGGRQASSVFQLPTSMTSITYTYLGCYSNLGVDSGVFAKDYKSMNPSSLFACATFCRGYKYFATEAIFTCTCDNALLTPPNDMQKVNNSYCNATCNAYPSRAESCGGQWKKSIYQLY